MSNSFRILLAGVMVVAFGAVSVRAQEKSNKEEPAKVKKEAEKPSKEQPAKEKPEAVKNEAEKPSKEQPAKEKPEAVKKEGEKPTKELPAAEKKTEKGEKPVEKKPETSKKGDKPLAKAAAKEGTMVEAFVKSVDAGKNSITVILKKNDEKIEQTFAVEKDARFLVGGSKIASLADVKPESRVTLILTEQKTVAGIKSGESEGGKKGPIADGHVKSVDAEKNEITLTFKNENEAIDQTYGVAKDARIFVGGSEAKIADLKPGTRAAFMLTQDKKTITAIKAVAEGEKVPGKKKAAK